MVGGYAIFELPGKEEALAMAVEFMQLHKDLMPGWEGTCESLRRRSPAPAASGRPPCVGGDDGRRQRIARSSPSGGSNSRG